MIADGRGPVVVACGALASELRMVLGPLGAHGADVHCLPAPLHNRPDRIAPSLTDLLDGLDLDGRRVLIGYADCGTTGGVDAVVADLVGQGIDAARLSGDHCYEFFAGSERFHALHADEPGTFYLTDFLARHFDALVWSGLGLDRHPHLRDVYFGNYRRVILLSQSTDGATIEPARRAASRLGLEFQHHHVGRDALVSAVAVNVRRVAA